MIRARTRPLLAVAFIAFLLLQPLPARASGLETAASGRVPVVVVAIHGDIFAVPVRGGVPRRLTAYGLNSSPQLSPDGRLIAYLSASRRYMTNGNPTTHGIWIVPVNGRADGSSAYKITITNPAVDRGNVSWSPDGRRLAYYEGATVVVGDVYTRRHSIVLRIGRPYSRITGIGGSTIAWSPDGRRIAVALPDDPGGAYPRELHVAIADLATGRASVAFIHFPAADLGRTIPPGSYPAGDGLAWSPDGWRFVVETLAEGEGPPRLTGLWQVPVSGGTARLFIGTPTGTRQAAYPAGSPLDNASHVIFSPDRTHLATDPANRFWLAAPDGTRGRYLSPNLARGCVLTQYAWLADSSGLAYVTNCTRQPSMAIRAHLYVLAANGAQPRELYSELEGNPGRLDPIRFR